MPVGTDDVQVQFSCDGLRASDGEPSLLLETIEMPEAQSPVVMQVNPAYESDDDELSLAQLAGIPSAGAAPPVVDAASVASVIDADCTGETTLYGVSFVAEGTAVQQVLVQVPASYKQAMSSPQATEWKVGCDEEMATIMQQGTWELINKIDVPTSHRVLSCKWVFAIKRDELGRPVRYKCRLVVRGCMQQEGIDYNLTYAPVADIVSLRALIAVAAKRTWPLRVVDIKCAFLNGCLQEEVFMKQPEGYVVGDGSQVCHLLKTLYGLKQSPKEWYERLRLEMGSGGYSVSEYDPGLFLLRNSDGVLYMSVPVDDCFMTASTVSMLDSVVAFLSKHFDCRDMGDPKQHLGMQVIRDVQAGTIKLCQRVFVSDLLVEYGMQHAKSVPTPCRVASN
jgi:hypothetical protein